MPDILYRAITDHVSSTRTLTSMSGETAEQTTMSSQVPGKSPNPSMSAVNIATQPSDKSNSPCLNVGLWYLFDQPGLRPSLLTVSGLLRIQNPLQISWMLLWRSIERGSTSSHYRFSACKACVKHCKMLLNSFAGASWLYASSIQTIHSTVGENHKQSDSTQTLPGTR